MSAPQRITSRDNPLLVRVRKLARGGPAGAGHAHGREVWLEGEHLCDALTSHGGRPGHAVVADSAWSRPRARELARCAERVVVVPDGVYASLSALESPAGLGFLWPLPEPSPLMPGSNSIVLDRLQDPGNVGSILRTAAALGFGQVLALRGTVGLWSPKVLRAGMGAHFALRLHEGLRPEDFDALDLPLVGTSLQAEVLLHACRLPSPCAWIVGHEGQGVDPALLARCVLRLRIAQPGGQESLNAAAAAAICLYESCRQALAQAG